MKLCSSVYTRGGCELRLLETVSIWCVSDGVVNSLLFIPHPDKQHANLFRIFNRTGGFVAAALMVRTYNLMTRRW